MRTSRYLSVALLAAASCAFVDVSAASEQPTADGIQVLLRRLEQVVQSGDADAYAALLSDSADRNRARDFTASEIGQAASRAVIQERDREPIRGALPGGAYRLMVDVFGEFGNRARAATWRLDVRRVPGASED